jgi:hypothetical protein
MNINKKAAMFLVVVVCVCIFGIFFHRSGESARRYQYQVISVTGMTELRTQSDAAQGRIKAIEKILNDQAAQGWELYQADGYILYFRR